MDVTPSLIISSFLQWEQMTSSIHLSIFHMTQFRTGLISSWLRLEYATRWRFLLNTLFLLRGCIVQIHVCSCWWVMGIACGQILGWLGGMGACECFWELKAWAWLTFNFWFSSIVPWWGIYSMNSMLMSMITVMCYLPCHMTDGTHCWVSIDWLTLHQLKRFGCLMCPLPLKSILWKTRLGLSKPLSIRLLWKSTHSSHKPYTNPLVIYHSFWIWCLETYQLSPRFLAATEPATCRVFC